MRVRSAVVRGTALLAVFALAGTVSACSATEQEGSEDRPALEVWSRSGPDAAETYIKVLDAFTEKTGIEVDYQAVPEFDTQLAARASDKDLPDVLINDASSLGNYVAQGFLLPIDRESIEGQDEISDETWDQNLGLDGAYYGIPWSRQANGVIVRKDWRESLGIDIPTDWDELAALANAFATRDPDGNGQADTYGMVVPGSAKNGYMIRWGAPYIWQAGGDLLESNGDGTYESVIDSPETEEAMEWVRDQFCTPGNIVPGSVNLTTAETPFFQEGTAGIYLTGPYNLSVFDAAVGKENVEVIPMPAGPAGTTTYAEGENIYFGASSELPDEQKALAEFLISAEGQELGMSSGETLPSGIVTQAAVRLPVNTTVDVGAVTQDERWQIFADDYANDSKPFPWAINFIPFRQIVADGMNAIMADCSSDIPALLKTIDAGFEAELEAQGLSK